MATTMELTLTDLLAKCHSAAFRTELDPDEAQQAIGYFPVYFPEEIVHAAGLRPFALYGGGNRMEVRYADARIGSFVCSICRTTTELGLNGDLSTMKGFFAQPICDAAKHMAGIWGRNFPDQEPQLLALPQNVNTPGSVQYIRDEYQRLRVELERRTGLTITDDAIRNSIRVYNEDRRLQRELYRIKRDDPARLTTVEAYLLVRAGMRMRREEHVEILQQALRLIAERPAYAMDKPRVIFLGGFCEQPPLEMIEAIEDTCFIVDDDLLIGQRWIVEDVSETGDPVWALAEAYVNRSASSPVQFDARKPKTETVLTMLHEAHAEAAIISAAKFCEPGLDDQHAQSRRLDAEKIPHLILEFEEKMTNFEQMAMQVETFAESLLFK